MKVGEKVLLLLPTKSNKLLMHWKGPYTIVENVGNVDYRIKVGDKVKTFHANMLRPYREREAHFISTTGMSEGGVLGQVSMAVVDIEIHDDQTDTENSVGPPSV